MRRRAIVVVMLMAFGLPGAASAGGPAGFFFRGSFSGSDAAVAGGVFGAVALGFAGAGEAYRGTGWRDDPATLIIDATPPGALVYLAAAITLAAMWLREANRRVLRWEALRSGAPLLLVLALAGLIGCDRGPALSAQQAARVTRGGDARRGADALRRFGCGACHVIPGIAGASGQVGPPLGGVGGRAYIAGVLTNTPENMIRWIVNPRGVDSLTAMPILGVSAPEARDIAAYLYTRR